MDKNLVLESCNYLATKELAEAIISGKIRTKEELEREKRYVARKYSLKRYPSTQEVLENLPKERRELIEKFTVHPRRSSSGIVVVTAFVSPSYCPHGTCIFCPGGPRFGTPQSYLKDSPGMRKAIEFSFDPVMQVQSAIRKYELNGHDTSKVEAIIEGGTFLALEKSYQENFVKGIFDGLNGSSSLNLEQAKLRNENAEHRCVGLTVETKPDWCREQHVDLMLSYGVTRVEIGVQSLNDEVLKFCNRGHNTEDTINAIRVAKDSGLKVCVHMMPGLPLSSPEQDLNDYVRLFTDSDLLPDMTKFYPTLVVPGTSLERMYRAKMYKPYTDDTVIELLSEMKRYVPKWHRIMRIQREIPSYEIVGGVKSGNLRELVLQRAREKGYSCNCIRCREVSLSTPHSMLENDEMILSKIRYEASGGVELFISYEFAKSGKIAAFVRLRHPSSKAHRPELKNACVVRELRVYGRVVSIGRRNSFAWQHSGLGKSLMREAERAAMEDFDCNKILVISAVGTRNYYRGLGYWKEGPYMAKKLT